MKRALIVAAALGLLLPCASMAQQNQQNQQNQPYRPKPGVPNNGPGGRGGPARPTTPARPNRPQPNRPQPNRPQMGRPPQAGRPGYQRPPTYVRPLPPRGNQFWHRGSYFGRIHGPAFAYPRGWGYRQWQIGQRLPPLFLAPNYIYPGWAALGLQSPPPGYVWVRFGPDLLLVNQSTDEVEDVVYGVFM